MRPNAPLAALPVLARAALLDFLPATKATIGSHPPAGSVTGLPGEECPIREIHAHLRGFHFYSRDPLPFGLSKLMMGFTADGQADPAMVAARDRDEHIEYGEIRAGVPTCPPGRSRRRAWPDRPVFCADASAGWVLSPARTAGPGSRTGSRVKPLLVSPHIGRRSQGLF